MTDLYECTIQSDAMQTNDAMYFWPFLVLIVLTNKTTTTFGKGKFSFKHLIFIGIKQTTEKCKWKLWMTEYLLKYSFAQRPGSQISCTMIRILSNFTSSIPGRCLLSWICHKISTLHSFRELCWKNPHLKLITTVLETQQAEIFMGRMEVEKNIQLGTRTLRNIDRKKNSAGSLHAQLKQLLDHMLSWSPAFKTSVRW